MANALVVGANGFLGSHLVDALAAAGHRVRAFDRFSGERGPIYTAPNVELRRGEFLSRTDLESAVEGQDLVFHFLSTTTPATAERDPTLDVRTNIAQTIELLESCVSAGVQHFYFASTGGAIYGNQGKHLYSEGDRALPVSPYAIGKLTIEHYLRYFQAMHGLDSTILRISNPYGSRQHSTKLQGFIPIALRHIMRGEKVVQFGDGSMVRDYIYVEDAVQMILRIVASGNKSELYNIGSGHGSAVEDVITALRAVTLVDFEIERVAVPPTFVNRVVLDIDRYRSQFGEFTALSLADGIERTFRGMSTAHA
ncbi:MAG: NAD-dependent epimerase/dehydratase family protein [Kineosporiaceae bacterium]|nr:NAD-dependent epimerase/dehydratase family protein [Aeromicrobium sp.]